MTSTPGMGCCSNFVASASAGGQSEHPSEVNSSTTTGLRPGSVAAVCAVARNANTAQAASTAKLAKNILIAASRFRPRKITRGRGKPALQHRGMFATRPFPVKYGLADARHRLLGDFLGAPRAVFEDVPHFRGIRFVLRAPLLNRCNPFHQRIRHQLLAIDAANCGSAAFAVDALDARAVLGGFVLWK